MDLAGAFPAVTIPAALTPMPRIPMAHSPAALTLAVIAPLPPAAISPSVINTAIMISQVPRALNGCVQTVDSLSEAKHVWILPGDEPQYQRRHRRQRIRKDICRAMHTRRTNRLWARVVHLTTALTSMTTSEQREQSLVDYQCHLAIDTK